MDTDYCNSPSYDDAYDPVYMREYLTDKLSRMRKEWIPFDGADENDVSLYYAEMSSYCINSCPRMLELLFLHALLHGYYDILVSEMEVAPTTWDVASQVKAEALTVFPELKKQYECDIVSGISEEEAILKMPRRYSRVPRTAKGWHYFIVRQEWKKSILDQSQ